MSATESFSNSAAALAAGNNYIVALDSSRPLLGQLGSWAGRSQAAALAAQARHMVHELACMCSGTVPSLQPVLRAGKAAS